LASFDDLSIDVLANILGFLSLQNIMRSRCINKKTTEAVMKAIVPPTKFFVNSVIKYHAMGVMTRALPNLQQITLGYVGERHKYSDGEQRTLHPLDIGHKYADGEDPDEEQAAETAHYTSHDIQIISNFWKLNAVIIVPVKC
jgi:hypothetical protein